MEENMHKLSETVGKIRSEIEQSSARNGKRILSNILAYLNAINSKKKKKQLPKNLMISSSFFLMNKV